MSVIEPYTIKHRTPYWEFKFPTYEEKTTQWYLDNIQPDWVCVDGGANVGYFTVLFSRLAKDGKVIAIEPTNLMDKLQLNCREMGCQNVLFKQVALGNKTGKFRDGIRKIWGKPLEVRAYTFTMLDLLLAKLTRLDLLKLDLDGYEHEALLGGLKIMERFNPFIVVELNEALKERNSSLESVIALLDLWGYKQVGQANENFIFKKP